MRDPKVDPQAGDVVEMLEKGRLIWRLRVERREGETVMFRGNLHGTPRDMPYGWTVGTWQEFVAGAAVVEGR